MKKKLLIAAMFIACTGSTFAQKGEKAVGLNLNYGSEISNLGIGAKFQYGITDAIRIEPSFNYYLKKNGVGLWDINANVHYLFNVAEKIKVYPLAGIGYANCEFQSIAHDEFGQSVDYSSSEIAVNLGVGAEYALNEKLSIGAELKYQIINNFNQIVFAIGASYKF